MYERLVTAHFHDCQPFGDEVCGKRRGQVIDVTRSIKSQRYPLNVTDRLPQNTNFHTLHPCAGRTRTVLSDFGALARFWDWIAHTSYPD